MRSVPEKMTFRNLLITSIIGALTFAVAFSWKDAIQATFEVLLPAQEALMAKWVSAFLITVVVVIIAVVLYRLRDVVGTVVTRVRRRVKRSPRRRR